MTKQSPDPLAETTARPLAEASHSITAVLRNRFFLFLWMAQAITMTGQNGIHFTQIAIIEELTHSSTHIGIVIISFSIPAVLFSTIAGIVVDRVSNKFIMVFSNILRALTGVCYLIAIHTLSGASLLLTFYATTFINSAIGQFFGPCEAATIPRLVRRDQLLGANSLFNLTFISTQVVGLIIIFPLILKLGGPKGFDASFLFVVVIYIIATVLVWLLPTDRPKPHINSELSALHRVVDELREGWQFVWTHSSIYIAMMQLTLIATLFMVMAMLAPGFATRVLGMSIEDAIYVFAPAGIGMILATVLLSRYGHRIRKETLANFGLLAMVPTFGALAWVGSGTLDKGITLLRAFPEATIGLIPAIMGIAFILGLALTAVSVPAQTILQEVTSSELRGRVFAVQFLLANIVAIPPTLFIGTLADAISIPRVTLIVAAIILAAWAMSVYFSRHPAYSAD
jgi:MFS family permease